MTNKTNNMITIQGNDYIFNDAIDLEKEETLVERLDRLIEEAIVLIKENEKINIEIKQQREDLKKKTKMIFMMEKGHL